MFMAVSIKDIAKEANVSPSTVSRALNNHPHISDKTKKQIRILAKEMEYVPSFIARDLVGQHSATIGVAIADFLNPFYSDIVASIEDVTVANNYQVFVSSFYRDKQRELELFNIFYERRFAGIIVSDSLVDDEYLSLSHSDFMPVVLINCPHYPFSVSVDKVLGARLAVEYLVELGHRRIAFIRQGFDSESARLRLNSFRETLNEYGITVDERYIMAGDERFTGGVHAVPQLLALAEPPTAVFCFNDMTAIGVIKALQQRGYKVPQDLSVIGFDDLDIASFYHPSLTTVRQPIYQIGRSAAKMLYSLIQRKENIQAQVLEPELVIRESTAPLNMPI
jgi:DNA-binding LacI/PurR family transcriptional regulator